MVLVAAFILPGLVGHDPWKSEDAVGFGIVHQMVSSGDWLAPRLAGEPFYGDGPLYFWVAGPLVWALAGILPPHDAARFASAVFILAALWFVRLAAKKRLVLVSPLWRMHKTKCNRPMMRLPMCTIVTLKTASVFNSGKA